MKIEPCPFCGSDVRYSLGTLSALCKNPECSYEGPIDDEGAEKHNRLSRIVRAAEDWVREEKIPGNLSKIQEAEDALRNAVEGGRADG